MRAIEAFAIAGLFSAGFALSCGQAGAATLISVDLASPGDGLLTVDTATSLQWLDLTAAGQLRSAVMSGSFVAQGFRYATQNEVLQLWQDAGSPGPFIGGNDASQADNVAPATLLINLMGCTSQFDGPTAQCIGDEGNRNIQNFNIGLFGSGPTDAGLVDLYFGTADPRRGTASLWINFGSLSGADLDNRPPDVGSYLVRSIPVSAVPEPDVWAMMILGFGFVGFALRRRRDMEFSAAPA